MQSASVIGPWGSPKQPAKCTAEIGQRGGVDRARDQRDRDAARGGVLRDHERRLGQQRLPVAAAFAGDRPSRRRRARRRGR